MTAPLFGLAGAGGGFSSAYDSCAQHPHPTLPSDSSKPKTKPETDHKRGAPLPVHTLGDGDALGERLRMKGFHTTEPDGASQPCPGEWGACFLARGVIFSGLGEWATLRRARFAAQSPLQLGPCGLSSAASENSF